MEMKSMVVYTHSLKLGQRLDSHSWKENSTVSPILAHYTKRCTMLTSSPVTYFF